ncbi:hypothetical protein PTKIN_Ptkin14bG0011900 [Pterospermum kingtungense]
MGFHQNLEEHAPNAAPEIGLASLHCIFDDFYCRQKKMVLLLVPSIALTGFHGLGFYHFLFIIPILVLSTSFIVRFTKITKVVCVEKPASIEDDQAEEKVLHDQPMLKGTDSESDAVPEPDNGIESSDGSSSSENLELNQMVSGDHVEQNPEIISDDSSSEDDDDDDEEGLIEIAIPGLSEEPKAYVGNFMPAESIFKQQADLVELLMAEMNDQTNYEEENLIEIDISMGSIKCPSFEIEA